MTGSDLLRDLSTRLRALELAPYTVAGEAEVFDALESPWQGIQVLAGRVLDRWVLLAERAGTPRPRRWVERLRGWLLATMARPGDWGVALCEASVAVARSLAQEDHAWALSLVRERGPEATAYLVLALPVEVLAMHHREVAREGSVEAKDVALRWLRTHALEGRREFLARRMKEDPVASIRELASRLHAEVVADERAAAEDARVRRGKKGEAPRRRRAAQGGRGV